MWLKPANSDYSQPLLNSWAQWRHAEWWRAALATHLAPHWETIFGHYALHLGGLGTAFSHQCRIREQYYVGPHPYHPVVFEQNHEPMPALPQFLADYTALPFAEHSIDAVSLIHVLEQHANPHAVLREVNRVLRADGYVIVAVTNPLSPGQLARLWPGASSGTPWQHRLFSRQRIRDWLALMHYEEVASGYFGTGVPWRPQHNPEAGWQWLLTQLPWARVGYYVVARKREWPLTPMRLRTHRQRQLRPESVTARMGS